MPEDDVRVMHEVVEAFNRRDGERLGMLLADDVEIVPVRAALEGTVYRGPDAGAQYCAAVEERWKHLRWEVEEVREGQGLVLAVGHIRGVGRDSGVSIDTQAAWLAHFRDGLITTFRTYANREEGIEASGLGDGE
ncbi:MAG: nuclear transport factor 2 family protein [Solirubrobacterales bacterium]|nr:nuclear transport factor 2 family protein [Solirubrobacterales bacterium]